jgi:hypothetical protein
MIRSVAGIMKTPKLLTAAREAAARETLTLFLGALNIILFALPARVA